MKSSCKKEKGKNRNIETEPHLGLKKLFGTALKMATAETKTMETFDKGRQSKRKKSKCGY